MHEKIEEMYCSISLVLEQSFSHFDLYISAYLSKKFQVKGIVIGIVTATVFYCCDIVSQIRA